VSKIVPVLLQGLAETESNEDTLIPLGPACFSVTPRDIRY
jgi:hypothetical protein